MAAKGDSRYRRTGVWRQRQWKIKGGIAWAGNWEDQSTASTERTPRYLARCCANYNIYRSDPMSRSHSVLLWSALCRRLADCQKPVAQLTRQRHFSLCSSRTHSLPLYPSDVSFRMRAAVKTRTANERRLLQPDIWRTRCRDPGACDLGRRGWITTRAKC